MSSRFGRVPAISKSAAPVGGGWPRTHIGTVVAAAGIGILLVAAITVITLGEGQIRYTADSTNTIPIWHPWFAAAVGIGLLLITPTTGFDRSCTPPGGCARADGFVLLALALTFTIALTLLGPSEPAYTALKSGLLLLGPLLLFAARRRFARVTRTGVTEASPPPTANGAPWWPLLPVLGWIVTYLALSLTHAEAGYEADMLTVVAAVLLGFLLNAVLEEFFYRRWLQTRWEAILGGVWPAIIVSSLTWASWHIAVQGTGDWIVDLANVFANQGITGLFLGLLWRRHRVMWPLLLVHGLMNANPLTLF